MPVTKYIYDGDHVLQETDEAGVPLKTYTRTPSGNLLSEFDGTTTRYYEKDGLGSTVALVDESQNVIARWTYRAFGAATQTLGTDSTPFTWVGQEGYFSDTETGLYSLGARYYDPATVQFLSPDPLGFHAGDPNLYRYVANNPTNRVDPHGTIALDVQNIGEAPRLGDCGEYAWLINWLLPATAKGSVIQRVTMSVVVNGKHLAGSPKTYWEGWNVENGKVTPVGTWGKQEGDLVPAGTSYHDRFINISRPNTTGSHKTFAKAWFFEMDLPDSFVPNGVPEAGRLRSTEKKPVLPYAKADNEIIRQIEVSWDCTDGTKKTVRDGIATSDAIVDKNNDTPRELKYPSWPLDLGPYIEQLPKKYEIVPVGPLASTGSERKNCECA